MALDARINDREARLVFATGSAVSLTVWERTAERLSLETHQEERRKMAVFSLETAGEKWPEAKALVMEFLPFPDVDGIIGWPGLQGAVRQINWERSCLQA